MPRMRWLVASILVATVGAAPVAADATETTALFHLRRGVAAFQRGDYLTARDELTIANRLVPERANPYRWLALTAVQLGDCQAARVHAEGFLGRAAPDDPRAPELVRLRELCERTGALTVTSTPDHAELRLDGVVGGATPYVTRSLRAGTHTLRVDHPGRAAATRTVLVPSGGELTVALRLPAPARPLYRRWWVWAAVAGTAAVATTAIVLTTDDAPATLPPIHCDALGCRP